MCVISWLFATAWTVAWQAPLSIGFFRQEYWSELTVPSLADLPNQGLNPHLLHHLHCRWILYPMPLGRLYMYICICICICIDTYLLSHVWLFTTPWTIAYQAPLSTGFSRQEYWSELLFFSPGDLPNPGIEPGSPALQVDPFRSEAPRKPSMYICVCMYLSSDTWINYCAEVAREILC